jgi:TonB family protein
MKLIAAICLCAVVGLLSFVTVPAQEIPKEIKGGILNGKATSLPFPEFPDDLKAAGIEATVLVDVVFDGSGTVISAVAQPEVIKTRAVNDTAGDSSIDSQLRQAAEKAALEAKFSPTLISGVPVNVSGSIVYSFGADGGPVNAGVINGKATSLPKPAYPDAAKAVGAGGNVVVQVIIDENGGVVSAVAISGHPLLRAASVEAARAAKFTPTRISGQPVRVAGMLTYNFFPPKKEETN